MKPNAGKLESKPAPKDDLKSLPMQEVLKKLDATAEGLTKTEAQKRLIQYGPNAIAEKKTNVFLKFLSYFWGPIPWMIEGAVVLSGVVGHWMDFVIILSCFFKRRRWFLGRTSGGQRHRRSQGQACH